MCHLQSGLWILMHAQCSKDIGNIYFNKNNYQKFVFKIIYFIKVKFMTKFETCLNKLLKSPKLKSKSGLSTDLTLN
ncbi:hypothetical protein BpHYR1_013124 [Brachionus plicatilis]|uniref:Uncharacterized protein n=1 Tax=Brachionus plicatilis TaxID=10195 RepID=A0A3M7Q9I6_BRAPC|nr:hypothetical protein BpHYR1_013124 [Brachionus plicatilis]